MRYLTEMILKAYSLPATKLRRDLEAAGVCGPFSGWTRDELIGVWLEHYAAAPVAVGSK